MSYTINITIPAYLLAAAAAAAIVYLFHLFQQCALSIVSSCSSADQQLTHTTISLHQKLLYHTLQYFDKR